MRLSLTVIITAAAVGLLFCMAAAAIADNQGPKSIEVYGGSQGNVSFPHAKHQDREKDCNVCHSVFPKERDAMKKMKEVGSLTPKRVMNLKCIKCHKQAKRDGKPHGPVTCKTCHVKQTERSGKLSVISKPIIGSLEPKNGEQRSSCLY